ncbi:MAG: Tim44 domain-containing protein [Alphaproteobacteria bacterium]|nr:Tim44 domain-containing protein [Alphaproteobacteria bacterium]
MPAELLVYIVIAAVLIIWLRNVLGTRNGEERDRSGVWKDLERTIDSQNSSLRKGEIIDIIDDEDAAKLDQEGGSLPQRASKVQAVSREVLDRYCELSREVEGFNPEKFVEDAKEAFALIVESFARGDTQMLKELLSSGVYNAFAAVIAEREERGETIQTDIHAVKTAEIIDVERKFSMVYLKIRFIADETCVVRNRDGQIISGNPDRSTVMNDIWTFGRQIKTRDPVWYLYETNDDVAEDHKTPLPEARE